jgi:hypothetical protein
MTVRVTPAMVETSAKSEFFRRWRGHLPDARIEHDWQERDNRRLLENHREDDSGRRPVDVW